MIYNGRGNWFANSFFLNKMGNLKVNGDQNLFQ